MVIRVFKNHKPTVSATRITNSANMTWMDREVENISLSRPMSFLPNSKVRKRLTADEREEETKENMATNPPTTLYMP